MDRSWWLDLHDHGPDSARLLPVEPYEELGLRDPVGLGGRPVDAGYG